MLFGTYSYATGRARRGKKGSSRVLQEKEFEVLVVGSICIFFMKITYSIFRSYVDESGLSSVVILTSVAWTLLYPIKGLLARE
jgi:hypothetical protein